MNTETMDLDSVAQSLPPEIKEAVERFGFEALAAKVYGVEKLDEKVACEMIGQKLAMRLFERRTLAAGLSKL